MTDTHKDTEINESVEQDESIKQSAAMNIYSLHMQGHSMVQTEDQNVRKITLTEKGQSYQCDSVSRQYKSLLR